MALTKQTLTLVSVYVFLFSTLYIKETSSSDSSPKSAAPSPSVVSQFLNLFPVKKEVVATPGKGAGVASKQLQAMEQKFVTFKNTIKSRLADPKTTPQKQKCLTQCDGNLDDAIEDVKTGIESITKGDLGKANMDISAVSTDIDACHECFNEMNAEDAEIKTFDEWVQGVTRDCLKSLKA